MSEQGLGTQIVTQIGLIVRDIDAYVERYSRVFGVEKPPIIITDEVDKARTTYHGESTTARAKLAFFHMGQVDIELIEPVGGPSTWQEHLDTKGEGVHHIAFVVKDTGQRVAYLNQHGIPTVQQGYYEGGMYTYLDSAPQLGVMVELLEFFK